MKKPTGKPAVVAGAATAALVLTAAPASAVPSTVWTVTPSPANVSLTNSANLVMNLNGLVIVCSKSTSSVTLRSATGAPATVGTVGSIAFGASGTPCTSVLGPFSMTPTTPWTFVAQDHTAATGVTKGYIGDIDMRMVVGSTVLRVQGKASATYTNSTGKLRVDSVAGELPVTRSTNGGTAFPVGTSLLLEADYLAEVSGTSTIPKIVGSNP